MRKNPSRFGRTTAFWGGLLGLVLWSAPGIVGAGAADSPEPVGGLVQTQQKVITITEESLESGWVHERQCHWGLLPSRELEIVYRRAVRNIRVTEFSGAVGYSIGPQSVTFRQVRAEGRLCLETENRILRTSPAGPYELTSGPYFRTVFDHPLPLRIDLTVVHPPSLLARVVSPAERSDVSITTQAGRSRGTHEIRLQGLVTGRLTVRIVFEEALVVMSPNGVLARWEKGLVAGRNYDRIIYKGKGNNEMME